jgi:hypothetical protein
MSGDAMPRRATDYFHPFPDPVNVFSSRIDEHCQYLLPLASIALDYVSPLLAGQAHFVMPIEPAPGWGFADRSTPYHNYLCRPNWVAYRNRQGKCEVACDFRFFHRAFFRDHPPQDRLANQEREDLEPHYADILAEFESRRQHFRTHGVLPYAVQPYRTGDITPDPLMFDLNPEDFTAMELVKQIGGRSPLGPWTSAEFPVDVLVDQAASDDPAAHYAPALPKTEDGRTFHFIATIEMSVYVGNEMTGWLHLFYDPMNEIALTTFEYD